MVQRHEEAQKEYAKILEGFAGTGKEVWSAGHRHGRAGHTSHRRSRGSPKARSGTEQATSLRLIQPASKLMFGGFADHRAESLPAALFVSYWTATVRLLTVCMMLLIVTVTVTP